jgi:hypothetical protein
MRDVLIAPLRAGEFKVWPGVADESMAVRVLARSPIAGVLQVIAGLESTNQMDDAEEAMPASYIATEDYVTRDHRHAFRRVRVRLMGETAIMVGALRTCATCGCTDDRACAGGCAWVTPDCCSKCVTGRVT